MEAGSNTRVGDGVDVRRHVHAMWSAVAEAWDEHAAFADARGAAAAQRMLELAELHEGARVLELACGAGGLGIAAASRVGESGEVVVSDVADEMTAIAERRAAELGLAQVTARTLDLEEIDEPDESFDAVLCREGLMFAFDPARAAAEIRRVLLPGGRAAVAVWGPRERNPWLGVVFDAVAAQLGRPVPPPHLPGPFSLSDAAHLDALLTDAGFEGVTVEELDVPMRAASVDEWWRRTAALAGPLTQILAALPPGARAELTARVREAARPYATEAGIEFPGVTLIAAARR
jgi:ubiquinone/menaquinone biosynthesis C-methylase UbiE